MVHTAVRNSPERWFSFMRNNSHECFYFLNLNFLTVRNKETRSRGRLIRFADLAPGPLDTLACVKAHLQTAQQYIFGSAEQSLRCMQQCDDHAPCMQAQKVTSTSTTKVERSRLTWCRVW